MAAGRQTAQIITPYTSKRLRFNLSSMTWRIKQNETAIKMVNRGNANRVSIAVTRCSPHHEVITPKASRRWPRASNLPVNK
jgi:hypothetical protein